MNYSIDGIRSNRVIKSIKCDKRKNKIVIKYLNGEKKIIDYTEQEYLELRNKYYEQAKMFSKNKDIKVNPIAKKLLKIIVVIYVNRNIIATGIQSFSNFGIDFTTFLVGFLSSIVTLGISFLLFNWLIDILVEAPLWLIGQIELSTYKKYFEYEKRINKYNEKKKEQAKIENEQNVNNVEVQLIDINNVLAIENLNLLSLKKLRNYVTNLENNQKIYLEEKGKEKILSKEKY